jgi:formate-dependent phosphoribosylglycinamide formyltransferase (GAR transformylase)
MHVLFLAPDTHVYNHGFLRGLVQVGARVSAIGTAAPDRLSPAARAPLAAYRPVTNPFDPEALLAAAREMAPPPFDRVETIDEPLVEPAALLRERLGIPGLSVETARLCRDKVRMKAFLRERGVACAESAAVRGTADAHAFAERVGFPLIVKPVAGFGSLSTWRVGDRAELDSALGRLKPSEARPAAIEEFIEGHEGFFDTLVGPEGVRFEFAAHYFPACLEANRDRTVSPQIAVTNRIEQGGYEDLRALGRKVVDALGIRGSATHMEWFFGPKGLKFSEIGARPAGERIWDMYRVAGEFDVYREWALAVLGRPAEQRPGRRYAVGSVQVRPGKDGRYVSHRGVEEALLRVKPYLYDCAIPRPGSPTQPLDKGWLVNTWFRLRHEDYDRLRDLMTWIGRTVKADAR